MDLRTLSVAATALILSSGALAANDTPPPAEQAAPQTMQQLSPDPYAEINKRVQEKLHERGFYDGPVNGDFGWNTQAALAQFQLSVPLPASGMLDETTLAALGIEPPDSGESPSAGASPAGEREADAASTGPAAPR
jgi:peptidoglycan hydrolase-like protein with peptidoglycan-binding domain